MHNILSNTARGPWAHDKSILDYDRWARRDIIADGDRWARRISLPMEMGGPIWVYPQL
jgi:hypothetical protein